MIEIFWNASKRFALHAPTKRSVVAYARIAERHGACRPFYFCDIDAVNYASPLPSLCLFCFFLALPPHYHHGQDRCSDCNNITHSKITTRVNLAIVLTVRHTIAINPLERLRVCVCVREREREKRRRNQKNNNVWYYRFRNNIINTSLCWS